MKAFVIAMLAVGTAMLLTALFWPRPSATNLATTAAFCPSRCQDRYDGKWSRPKNSPPRRHATPARNADLPSAAISVPRSTNNTSYSAPSSNKPALEPTSNQPIDPHLTADEQLTLKQTGTDNTSLRNIDFPRTYISKIHVDLTSPNHWVTLTWSGPNARLQPSTKYHSSPGRGLGNNNCDDPDESRRTDSNCTPKGTMHVQAFSNSMVTSPACRYVTWFDTKRGIALHYYPFVPNYPASHGCVRLNEYAAQLIHNNSKIGETEVVVEGKWTFSR